MAASTLGVTSGCSLCDPTACDGYVVTRGTQLSPPSLVQPRALQSGIDPRGAQKGRPFPRGGTAGPGHNVAPAVQEKAAPSMSHRTTLCLFPSADWDCGGQIDRGQMVRATAWGLFHVPDCQPRALSPWRTERARGHRADGAAGRCPGQHRGARRGPGRSRAAESGLGFSVSEAGPVLVTELKFVNRRVLGLWPSHPRKKERLG